MPAEGMLHGKRPRGIQEGLLRPDTGPHRGQRRGRRRQARSVSSTCPHGAVVPGPQRVRSWGTGGEMQVEPRKLRVLALSVFIGKEARPCTEDAGGRGGGLERELQVGWQGDP